MPKFQVTVADEAGHKLYDETIEAVGPREACGIAAAESATVDAPDHAPTAAPPSSGVPGSGTSPFEVDDNSTTPEPLLSDLAKESPAR